MKKIILFIFLGIIVFLIYYFNVDKDITYLSIGDYLSYGVNNYNELDNNYNDPLTKYLSTDRKAKYYNYSFSNDYRVVDLIRDINYNNKIKINGKDYTVNNLLIKADIIILSIGMNDIYYQNNLLENKMYDYMDGVLEDLDKLFGIMRKYSKEKIYVFNYYNVIDNKQVINYVNKNLNSISSKYNIKVIDISDLDKYITDENIYPTNSGYTYIYNQIILNLQK